jgi:hypothetical protein
VAVTVYASVAQFTARLPQTAWGARTVADVQEALTISSADMDGVFRGLFPMPLLGVGYDVSRRCVDHARYIFMGGRGFSPENEADKDIVGAEADFWDWMDRVHRRVLFPNVTIDPTGTVVLPQSRGMFAQPTVASSIPRGWEGCGPYGRGVW